LMGFFSVSISEYFSRLPGLTEKCKHDNMNELDKGSKNIVSIVESKEGERGPLSSNKANVRSPSLHYEFTSSPERLDSAFDILFEEVFKNIDP